MIDLDTLRKAKGYVLAIVDESTGEYKPVSSDVVRVIRCKDCKAYNGMKCVRNNMIAVREDDFCSRAEPKQR